ncbi:hypothetical protein B0H11DRAFT_161273 [Mycena galericulata]|nr:hypothetical protein B0H11DRAFT_161273 [Mycena galericulata]
MSSRRLWKRSRSSKACTERKPSANEPAQPDERPEQIRRQNTANTPNTALNALKFTLQTLSSVSANVPMGSGLSSVIDTFLAVLTRIQQTSANAQGLAQLAERINHITPIIMSEDASLPSKGQIVEALQRELQLITKDLEASRSRGKLQQFFDSSENAACLAQHNMSLMQIVTTATVCRFLWKRGSAFVQ